MEKIVKILSQRYREKSLKSNHHEWICGMTKSLEENVNIWPVDKTNRWIGFIQGVMYCNCLLNIDEERDFTRPLFHEYYKKNSIQIPESVKVER